MRIYRGALAGQSPAVIPSHPPEPIMRLMHSLLPRLLRTPLAGGALKKWIGLKDSVERLSWTRSQAR